MCHRFQLNIPLVRLLPLIKMKIIRTLEYRHSNLNCRSDRNRLLLSSLINSTSHRFHEAIKSWKLFFSNNCIWSAIKKTKLVVPTNNWRIWRRDRFAVSYIRRGVLGWLQCRSTRFTVGHWCSSYFELNLNMRLLVISRVDCYVIQ